ncbi:MAG: patatin-like phospholipase family protein, partial [Halobacteria archaeon]|nr:patatin-like phospholipase family protein [Halobacteria archaeon]
MSKKKLAIACQGGGSHTAFTAGAIKKILRETENDYELVGFSGTSGGAICALITWYGIVKKDRQKAAKLLDSFWKANSATSYEEYMLNIMTKWGGEMRKRGVTLPEVSPYDTPLSKWALDRLRELVEEHVDFEEIENYDPTTEPALLVSAVDVHTGEFEIFHGTDISVDAILASCA